MKVRLFLELGRAVMIMNARFLGSVKCTRACAGELGSVVLGVGRVVGRRRMPECMPEP